MKLGFSRRLNKLNSDRKNRTKIHIDKFGHPTERAKKNNRKIIVDSRRFQLCSPNNGFPLILMQINLSSIWACVCVYTYLNAINRKYCTHPSDQFADHAVPSSDLISIFSAIFAIFYDSQCICKRIENAIRSKRVITNDVVRIHNKYKCNQNEAQKEREWTARQTTKMPINKNCIKCNAPIKSHLNEL